MKISQIEQVKKITYSAFLIALIVVLSQLMRIQIIPRTSIPLFLIPIFVAPWLLNWYWCFFIGFMGHLLSDVSLWGVTIGSLCWNIATGIIALSLFFIYKLPWHWLKIILILIVNIVSYAPIDFILFWFGISALSVEQIIFGVLIANSICLPIFYFLSIKIKNRILNQVERK